MSARHFELGDEEIQERFRELEAAGFPPEAAEAFAQDVVRHASGAVAEGIIRKLVNTFPSEDLSSLVGRYVMDPGGAVAPSGAHDWLLASSLVARRLIVLGCDVRSTLSEGCEVVMPDGDPLRMVYRQLGVEDETALPESGEVLCRLALMCVWLMSMRAAAD